MKKINLFVTLMLLGFNLYSQSNPYNVDTKTEGNIKSKKIVQSPKGVNAFINPLDWKAGMRFMPTPAPEGSVYYNSTIELNHIGSNSYSERLKLKDYQWKTFTFTGIEQEKDCSDILCERKFIFECEGKKYFAEIQGSEKGIRSKPNLYNISHLIYLDEVDSAKAKYVGKTLYIKIDNRLKKDAEGIDRYTICPKWVAVRIKSIGLGTQDGPAKFIFTELDNKVEYSLNISFSGINSSSGVFGKKFDAVFQETDPKEQYPNISMANWKKIQKGVVAIGMSKEICELSWGKPESINTTILAGESSEQWVYGMGSYLYFTNGKLSAIQD